jgi:pimeloyl-ACP methyl ester carboxylesterase
VASLDEDYPDAMTLHTETMDALRAGLAYGAGDQAVCRFDALAALRQVGVPIWLLNPPRSPAGAAIVRDYAASWVGQLLIRRSGPPEGRPLLVFHDSPLSGAMMEGSILVLGQDRPVIGFDTPGNGDSAAPEGTPEMWDLASLIAEVLASLGVDDFDSSASTPWQMLGMELAIARPQQVRHAIIEGVLLYIPEERAERLTTYVVLTEPQIEGTHLLWTLQHHRLSDLWYPWTNRTAPAIRHIPFPAAALSPNAVAFETPGTRTPAAMAATFTLFRQFLDDALVPAARR